MKERYILVSIITALIVCTFYSNVSAQETKTNILFIAIEAPTNMQGASLMPLTKGQSQNWRKELFLESLFTLRDNPSCEGMREGDWKYIRMFNGVNKYKENDIDFFGKKADFEQLFNSKDDPGEKNNLIDEYEGSELLERLRKKCSAQSVELNKSREQYKRVVRIQPFILKKLLIL